MSHGSYDLNLGSKRLILAGDIRSRSWPNIGDSYSTYPCITMAMGIFCDMLKFGSTAALDCRTGQNKGRY